MSDTTTEELLASRDNLLACVKALVQLLEDEVIPRRAESDLWTATKAELMQERVTDTCYGLSAAIEKIDRELEDRGAWLPPDDTVLDRTEALMYADYVTIAREEFAR